VWENKLYHEKPMLVPGDGPFPAFKRWYYQRVPSPQHAAVPRPQAGTAVLQHHEVPFCVRLALPLKHSACRTAKTVRWRNLPEYRRQRSHSRPQQTAHSMRHVRYSKRMRGL
jgi:hypothetical protein